MLTNQPAHIIERQALVATDGEALVVMAPGSEEQACDRAEERATPFDDHRHHVDHAPGIVVTYAAALHRRLLLAGERFLTLIDLALHVCKGMHFLSSLQASRRKS